MKIKHLIVLELKKFGRNININFLLLIVLIVGLCGLMVSTEFLNAIKEINIIIITVETKCYSDDNHLLQDIIDKVDKLDGIIEINCDNNLYIKTNEIENVNIIKKILHKSNYDFPIHYVNSDGSLSPKFIHIIERLSYYMLILLLIVTQIVFIIITLKKINLDSVEFATLKCIGYNTKDILTIVITQLLIILIISFFISIILSVFIISIISYSQEYVNLSFHPNTILKQVIILTVEYIFVCLITTIKIRKINLLTIN